MDQQTLAQLQLQADETGLPLLAVVGQGQSVSHQCVLLPQETLYSSGDQWTSSAEIHETTKFVNLALA